MSWYECMNAKLSSCTVKAHFTVHSISDDFDTKRIKWIFERRLFSGSFRTEANWCAKAISNFFFLWCLWTKYAQSYQSIEIPSGAQRISIYIYFIFTYTRFDIERKKNTATNSAACHIFLNKWTRSDTLVRADAFMFTCLGRNMYTTNDELNCVMDSKIHLYFNLPFLVVVVSIFFFLKWTDREQR